MKNVKPIRTIILCGDRHYLIPLLTLINNLICTSTDKYLIEVWFSSDTPSKIIKNMKELVETFKTESNFEFFKQGELIAPGYKYLTSGAWVRLSAFDNLREENSLILYLDCDIFLKQSWELIFDELPNHGMFLGALQTPGHAEFEARFKSKSGEQYYFNSGVLVFNSNWWLKNSFHVQWPEILNQYNKFGFRTLDQDVLNYLVRGNYVRISQDFNCYLYNITPRASIIHFAGWRKPWGLFKSTGRNFDEHLQNSINQIVKEYDKNLKTTLRFILLKKPVFGLYIIMIFYYRFTLMNLKNLRKFRNNSIHS
jgi:lipopolysaccharide biosynthesis glycosyltransferase